MALSDFSFSSLACVTSSIVAFCTQETESLGLPFHSISQRFNMVAVVFTYSQFGITNGAPMILLLKLRLAHGGIILLSVRSQQLL